MSITHTFVSGKADDSDISVIRPSNWNAKHTLDSWKDASDYASLAVAITAIGSTPTTLLIASSINASNTTEVVTVPATLAIMPISPGVINKGSATSLTINGPVVGNPMHQWLSGFAVGEVLFGVGSVENVLIEWVGGKGDNSTINTTPINIMIATGKNISLLDGTYLTVGGHDYNNGAHGQEIKGQGDDKTYVKRSSGTTLLFVMTGKNYTKLRGMTLDGNSLGGGLLAVRGTAQTFEDMVFKNSGGTSYALDIASCNRIVGNRLYFPNGNYGGILFGANALAVKLNDVQGGACTEYAIRVSGTAEKIYMDDVTWDVSGTGFLAVTGAYNIYDWGLQNFHIESTQTSGTVFEFGNAGLNVNLKTIDIVNTSATPSADPMFAVGALFDFSIEGLKILRPNTSTGTIIKLADTVNASIKNVYDGAATNSHIFLECAATVGSGPTFVTLENIYKTATGVYCMLKNYGYKITNSNMNFQANGTVGSIVFENISGNINCSGMSDISMTNCAGSISNAPGSLLQTINGKVWAASLGVGNSASATTLGTVTKKMEVFNAAGASLGYVPIYGSIT